MAVAYKFPEGFLWGAATSSHQVEGENRWNDWWEYEESGRLPHRSGQACRHYELYEQDFDLARSMGHNAHRFSIEWSRIEPAEGEWNQHALDHYRAVIAGLRRRNIEPVVTLHHFTNPAWFSHRGGWLRRDSSAIFSRYVARVAEYLGRDVKFWLTINEPTVYVSQGYVNGEWPPCLRGAWIKAAIVLLNLARAHKSAYRALHHYRRDLMVGFAHSAPLVLPCDPQRRRDRVAAGLRSLIVNDAFLYLIGARAWNRPAARRHLDFIGINYYTRMIIRSEGPGMGAVLGRACRSAHNHPRGPISDIGWEVYPPGLRMVLERFSSFGVPLFVTENGVATNDETLRCAFLAQHLANLAAALKNGVQVIGYLYWSLIDNYEWALGMTPHFGLVAVDPVNQRRVLRPAAEYFTRVCREKRLELVVQN